jgi:YHS domain-containing protein
MSTKKDPVCGMEIEESKAVGKSEYDGQTFYFCSQGCKIMFDQYPQQYLSKAKQQKA